MVMRHPEKSNECPGALRGFDTSGQVFTENIVAARDPIWDWPLKTRGSLISLLHFRNLGSGCSSLLDIATRACLARSTWFTPALVGTLPWNLACKLWSELTKNELDSVRVWQAFAANHPDAGPALRWKIQRVRHVQSLPLEVFTEPLCSDRGHWLSILTLQDIQVPRRSLVQGLAKITHLIALTIGKDVTIDPGMAIDDAIFRAWTRHYEDSAANVLTDEISGGRSTFVAPFGRLKVLNLRMQPHISARAFEHLGSLPQLSVMNIEYDSFEASAFDDVKRSGWRLLPCEGGKDPILASQMHQAGHISWDSLVRASLALSKSGLDGRDMSAAAKWHCEVEAPVLHLIVGPGERSIVPTGRAFDEYQGKAEINEWTLATFVRSSVDSKKELDPKVSRPKRALQGRGDGPSGPPRKKFGPRPSKLQDFHDVLEDFGHSISTNG